MVKKTLIGTMIALCLLFTSCYPELSVQQYDKLKEDLVDLDVQRQELEAEVATLEAEIAELRATNIATNTATRAYVVFLEKLISTQSSERILTGEFDVESLIKSSTLLTINAEELGDSKITYYLGLFNSENETQTVAAYYKTIEYCLKEIKQNLK